jgi:glutathione S-transferase
MQLVGQYDSPFVRRVAVALQIYGFGYEHLPWSTFGDREKVAGVNPLIRVPTLILDDGEALVESGAILDWLDELAGPERALIAASGAARRENLRIISLATGIADKAVSLFYFSIFGGVVSADFAARLKAQIAGTLGWLENAAKSRVGEWWHGGSAGHADIAVACVLRFLGEAHAASFDLGQFQALSAHCARSEALPAFSAVVQAFDPPK